MELIAEKEGLFQNNCPVFLTQSKENCEEVEG
jgi:hypothetical protein